MALIVPYQTNGFARRAMMQRAMTSVGTRAAGRPAFAIDNPRRTVQPVTRGFGDLCCNDCVPTAVSYEAAKRMPLGTLGVSTVQGAAKGASVGASVGSYIPVVGTAIGAILGGIGGAIASAFSRQDQEVQNFDQAQAIAKANGPQAVVNIANKYLVLAGLFDLQPGQIKGNIPFYKQYGRMGEQRFVADMMTRIYQAAQSGQITANDTPQTVYQNIVLPWMNSWGKGSLQDSNAEMITWILIGMIAEYVSGLQTRWYARGGDNPFGSLPKFALPLPPQAVLPPAQPPPALPAPVNPATACASPYVWNGSQCVLPASTPASAPNPVPTQTPASCVSPYVWNGTQCVLPAAAVPPSQNPGTAPSVPAGFQVVGTDSNGNAIFSNPQGVLYSWTGAGMQIWAGQLASNSSPAAQMQAALQNALAQGQNSAQAAAAALQQAQTAGVANTPQLQDQVAQQVAATSAAPVQPVAAGFGTGTIGLLVGGGIILSLLLTKMQENRGRSRA